MKYNKLSFCHVHKGNESRYWSALLIYQLVFRVVQKAIESTNANLDFKNV